MLLPTLPTLLLRLLPAVVTLKSHDDFTRQSLISLSKITLHSSLRAISLSSMMTLLSLFVFVVLVGVVSSRFTIRSFRATSNAKLRSGSIAQFTLIAFR